jgi:hypothetical protein
MATAHDDDLGVAHRASHREPGVSFIRHHDLVIRDRSRQRTAVTGGEVCR